MKGTLARPRRKLRGRDGLRRTLGPSPGPGSRASRGFMLAFKCFSACAAPPIELEAKLGGETGCNIKGIARGGGRGINNMVK